MLDYQSKYHAPSKNRTNWPTNSLMTFHHKMCIEDQGSDQHMPFKKFRLDI